MDPFKVLVIDDEEIARISCRRILERKGIGVTLSASGREGLDIIMREPHDLVLIDLKMPEMDGVEVARRIRDYDPGIVTIIITGYATIESAVAVMKEGAYDYLPKPFTPDELLIVVQRGLEKRRLDLESAALREEKAAMERNFVTMVTHQLRSPLSAIYQYLEVLLGGMGGDLSQAQQEIMDRMRERLEGLLNLIGDWLDMSRVKTGEILTRLQPVAVAKCVQDALACLEVSAAEKKIGIELDIPADCPEIHVDPMTFRELLSNLISNAIKYNREEGSICIRARKTGGWIVLDVEDTGFGFEEVEIPFLFEQFYRGKGAEVRRQPGTGLGLTDRPKDTERPRREDRGQVRARQRLRFLDLPQSGPGEGLC